MKKLIVLCGLLALSGCDNRKGPYVEEEAICVEKGVFCNAHSLFYVCYHDGRKIRTFMYYEQAKDFCSREYIK